MSRPAVIIGLGGTGQWVLTLLKKDLLEYHNMLDRPKEKIPNVRLVAFDTLSKVEANIKEASQKRYEGEKRVGNIQLIDNKEYLALGGDCKPIADKIQSNERDYRHLDFFQTKFYDKDLKFSDSDWFLEHGAGKFRQFGALSISRELLDEGDKSRMFRILQKAIKDVKPDDNSTKVEIIVVSSMVGGTGSGMIIPMGILLNKMIEKIAPRQGNFRAVAVLPSAFTGGAPNQEMNIRAMASLRELWRMQIPPDEPREVVLAPEMDGYQSAQYQSPYQGIYVVDGLRNNVAIGNVWEGVFPAIALWIQQVIDEEAGEVYRGYVETNRKGAGVLQGQRNAEGVFGTFGAFSMFTPEIMLKQTHSLKLVNAVIEHLASDYQIHDDDQNAEEDSIERELPPIRAARSWLRQDIRSGGTVYKTPRLFQEMARILSAGASVSGNEIKAKAWAGSPWNTRELGKRHNEIPQHWLPLFRDFEIEDNDENKYRQPLTELAETLDKRYPKSEASVDPTSPRHIDRLENEDAGVDAWIEKHHGKKGTQNDWGQFGSAVNMLLPLFDEFFREILKSRLLATLSAGGTAQKGRIHYAIETLTHMESDLKKLKTFLNKVAEMRVSEGVTIQAAAKKQKAHDNWLKTPADIRPGIIDKVFELFGRPSKLNEEMIARENSYLSISQIYVNCLREDAMVFYLERLLDKQLAYLQTTLKSLKTWRFSLSEGNPGQHIISLGQYSQEQLNSIQDLISKSKRKKEVEALAQVTEEEDQEDVSILEYKPSSEDLENALQGLNWVIDDDEEEGGLDFKLEVNPLDSSEGTMIELLNPSDAPKVIAKTQNDNMDLLLKTLGQSYKEKEGIVSWLKANKTAAELTKELVEKTETISDYQRHPSHGQYFIVSGNWEQGNEPYRDEIQDELEETYQYDTNEYRVTSFDNKYRLTAVNSQTGLILDDFNTWNSCLRSYKTYIKQKMENGEDKGRLIRRMQSFYTQREEQEAVSREITRVYGGFAYRMIDPRAVQLFGNWPNLLRAIKCFALDWVIREPDRASPGHSHWKLSIPDLPEDEEIWLTRNEVDDADQPTEEFDALHGMVVNAKNQCNKYGRQGTSLDTKTIDNAINKADEIETGKTESKLMECYRKALEDDGLIARWRQKAGREVSASDAETFLDPAYWDIADIAFDVFKDAIPED